MGKTKLIAISGICAGVAVVCMLLSSVAFWATLILSVVASIAVVVPMLVDPKGLTYSLLVYAVASVLGVFAALSLGNIVYVAPLIAFGMPFAIVKVCGETVSVSAQIEQKETYEDPFGNGEDTHVLAVEFQGKKRFPTFVKWILYYVLLEVAIGLTLLAAYLFAKPLFTQIVDNSLFYLLLAAMQLIVIPYDLLMRGCLIGARKVLKKAIR